jgi:hypothetical protein
MVGAQPGDVVGDELIAGVGERWLVCEDHGDLRVRVALGELADKRDGVPVDARVWLPARANANVCSAAWPPSHATGTAAQCYALVGRRQITSPRIRAAVALGRDRWWWRVEHITQVDARLPPPDDLHRRCGSGRLVETSATDCSAARTVICNRTPRIAGVPEPASVAGREHRECP